MIKIKVLDKELSFEEAKELYLELHKIFGNKPYEINRTDCFGKPPIIEPFDFRKKQQILCDGKEFVKLKDNNKEYQQDYSYSAPWDE